MAVRGFFAHESPDGDDVRERARAQGFAGKVAENVAWGQASPAAVVEAWSRSADHCRTMMSPRFSATGVGFARGAAGKTFWTEELGTGTP